MGFSARTYFGLNGFLPGLLTAGKSPDLLRLALTALNRVQIPASLVLLGLAGRLVRRPAGLWRAGALLLVAVTGCVVMSAPPRSRGPPSRARCC